MRFQTLSIFIVLMWLTAACGSPEKVAVSDIPTESAPQPTQPADAEPEEILEEEVADAELIIDQLASVFPGVPFATAEIDPQFVASEWSLSEPEAQGLNSEQLSKLGPFLEEQMSHIHSVLVVRNDALVYEYYKEGRTRYSADIVWSVTKSVTSLLIGIAVDEGLFELDQSLGELLPADQLATGDPNLAAVTLHDLLTMTSGVACPGDRCHDASVPMMISRDLNYETGEKFLYDTGATHLLSAVLAEATGMSIDDYAAEKLFVPLGIEPPPWQIDADGVPFGGKGLAMRPRDMALLGQLILDDGVWNGEQLVPADYISRASENQVSAIHNEGYGYLFWIDEKGGAETISAVGYGGQFITVIPEHDMVVVITADFTPAKSGNDAIIESFILEAIVD